MKIGTEIAGYKIHPAAQKFPPMEDVEFEALCADIAGNGLLEPIMRCEYEGETVILDGRHRLLACLKCEIELENIEFDDYGGNTPVAYVVSRNKHRRHLKPGQLAMIAAELKSMYEEEAKKRQEAAQFKKDEEYQVRASGPVPDVENSSDDEQETGRARDQAGASMGVSGRSVARAEKVIAGGCDELQDAVRNGVIDVTMGERLAERPVKEQRQILKKIEDKSKQNAKAVVKRHDKDKIIERLKSEPYPPPEGPFCVITADPSWMFDKRPDDGTQRGQTPYPGMTLDEIMALGTMVNKLAHDDCILWLWVPNSHVPVASDVLDAWDFTYKTNLTWKKPKMGVGDWLRGITEQCFLAVRGKPTVNLTNETTCIEGAVREHSRKPEEFFKMVEKLCPGSKLEMFATEPRENWQIWAPGNWREEEK